MRLPLSCRVLRGASWAASLCSRVCCSLWLGPHSEVPESDMEQTAVLAVTYEEMLLACAAVQSHFRDQHFPCEDRGCLEKKFVVFSNEIELKVSRGLACAACPGAPLAAPWGLNLRVLVHPRLPPGA